MARTCANCGYTAQSNESKRCVLCKTPFPDSSLTLNLPSRATKEPLTVSVDQTLDAPRAKRATTRDGDKVIRGVIAILTCLHGLVGSLGGLLLFGMVLLEQIPASVVLILLGSLAFFARGLCGLVGAIALWRDLKIGFQLSTICWGYNVVIGLIASTQFPFLDFSDPVMARHLGSTIGKLVFGIPIFYFLMTRLLKWNCSTRR